MRAFALSLLVVSASFAQDVPRVVVLAPGEKAPEQGLFLPEPVAIEQAKRIKACEAENKVLADADAQKRTGLILAIAAALIVGGAAGAGAAYALKR